MVSQYIILSRILDYLRVDEYTSNKIRDIEKENKDALYLYDIMQISHKHLVKKGSQIHQFKYQVQLPKTYYTSYPQKQKDLLPNSEMIDFNIALSAKEITDEDKYCIQFLEESNYLNKTDLSILLLIMTLPNWHIGVYPPNKGENKHR